MTSRAAVFGELLRQAEDSAGLALTARCACCQVSQTFARSNKDGQYHPRSLTHSRLLNFRPLVKETLRPSPAP